jgi:hypothetical protein
VPLRRQFLAKAFGVSCEAFTGTDVNAAAGNDEAKKPATPAARKRGR